MNKRFLILALPAAAVLVAAFQWISADPIAPPAAPAESAGLPEITIPPSTANTRPRPEEPPPAEAATPAPAARPPREAGSPLAAELNSPTSDAARDVETLHALLRQYFVFLQRRPGHPIGNDTDLARVLTGHNPMKRVVLPPTHPALSPDGRLRDRWGTPYFIHPRGGGAYEIRSAGFDRKLFTADDAIANPPPGRAEPVEGTLLGDPPEP
jgi:hypothetical protein